MMAIVRGDGSSSQGYTVIFFFNEASATCLGRCSAQVNFEASITAEIADTQFGRDAVVVPSSATGS